MSEDSVATITGAQMILGFPYLKNGNHLSGKYTLTARFACANHLDPDPDDPAPSLCTGDRRVRISVLNGGAFDVTGYGDDVSGYLNLPRGQDTQVLEWTARGQCKIADGTDCSV